MALPWLVQIPWNISLDGVQAQCLCPQQSIFPVLKPVAQRRIQINNHHETTTENGLREGVKTRHGH